MTVTVKSKHLHTFTSWSLSLSRSRLQSLSRSQPVMVMVMIMVTVTVTFIFHSPAGYTTKLKIGAYLCRSPRSTVWLHAVSSFFPPSLLTVYMTGLPQDARSCRSTDGLTTVPTDTPSALATCASARRCDSWDCSWRKSGGRELEDEADDGSVGSTCLYWCIMCMCMHIYSVFMCICVFALLVKFGILDSETANSSQALCANVHFYTSIVQKHVCVCACMFACMHV